MAQSRFGKAVQQLPLLAAAAALPFDANAASITLYNAQHEQVVDMLAKDFEKQSGISVKIRNGEGPALAAQLVAEGAATPADVYFTENSPELMLLEEKGPAREDRRGDARHRFPRATTRRQGNWVGVVRARERARLQHEARSSHRNCRHR